ncbi:hypothetical protein L6164_008857 [Bauhinia variegata]|uniref:Uncharacterized protein n=1 Tax=Bauhinia variegata TaxID=167791 RepID=A0ACB9PI24_BAUVA|nr:hypothetical protein L6164_008857 [Bauhinia variegata]
MASSNSRNSGLRRRSSSSASSAKPQSIVTDQTHTKKNSCSNLVSVTVDGILLNVYDTPMTESILLDAQITLIDTPANSTTTPVGENAGQDMEYDDVKMAVPSNERLSSGVFAFDYIPSSPFPSLDKVEASVIGFGNGVEGVGTGGGGGRRKRWRPVLEQLDKAAQQRQKRMIKNRESAARSRKRKQAHEVELETLVVRLREENEQLMKEKVMLFAQLTWLMVLQLMEKVIPVVEKRRLPQGLRRVRSSQW